MSATALALLIALVGQAEAPEAETEPRTLHSINQDVRAAFRAEARAETLSEREAPIRRLAELHRELIADPRLADSDYLQNLRGLIYSRLTRVRDDLQRDIDREADDGQAAAAAEPAPLAENPPQETIDPAAPRDPFAPAPSPGELAAKPTAPAGAHGGGVGPRDLGEELVELIQHTISPEHWDVNGGPGAIVYYEPLKVLVVRASGDVHGRVRNLNDALRRAGN